MTIVQIAGGSAVNSVNCPGTLTFTQAFTSPNTAGNTLLVILGCDTGNITSTTINTFSDTLANTYTQIFDIDHGTNTGPALGAYWFPNCAAGGNSVTVEYNCACIPPTFTTNFYPFMIVAEIAGLTTTPTVQAQNTQQNFASNSVSVSITNSLSSTITLGATCKEAYNTWAIIDLLASGIDNYFVCGIAANNAGTDNPVLAPSTAGVPNLAASVPNPLDINSTQSTYLALYTMGPGTIAAAGEQRGHIDADQIGLDARQGPLYGLKVVYSDGTFTQGGIPAFRIDGTLTNSGNNAGAGPGSGSISSVTASSPLTSSGGANPNISIASPISVADGGTGTGSPGLVAGTAISITGTWPDQTIASTGTGVAGFVPWSGLTNPAGNVSLTMGADTTLLTYDAATGSSDLFELTDTTNNTGTGALLNVTKASGSGVIDIRLKQLSNSDSEPLLQLENSSAAAVQAFYICNNSGVATARIDSTGAQFLVTRGTNTLLFFNGTGGKCLTTMTCNFDGVTPTEVGITLNNIQSMSGGSKASILSVQNDGTRVFDVAPSLTQVTSGQFGIATTHTPSSSTDTGTTGQIAWDGSFLYVCTATNTWVRTALTTF